MARLEYADLGNGISYSRLQALDTCPRYYQIANVIGYRGAEEDNIDFAYGHSVATGIQHLIQYPEDLDGAIIRAMRDWNIPFYEENKKSKKSVWFAIEMVRRFYKIISQSYTNPFKNFEIAMFKNSAGVMIPAIELTFLIHCPKGYKYEGHIDLVLKEKGTNNFVVLELKTTSFSNLSPAMYQNSIQALGYAIVLDQIASEQKMVSSYSVFYWVVKSGQFSFEPFVFPKDYHERINFLNHLLVKIELLELYKELNFYPMHGQSCYNFFRDCEYINVCKMADETLKVLAGKPKTGHTFAQGEGVDFTFDFEDIKATQLAMAERRIIPTVSKLEHEG